MLHCTDRWLFGDRGREPGGGMRPGSEPWLVVLQTSNARGGRCSDRFPITNPGDLMMTHSMNQFHPLPSRPPA